MSQEQTQTTSGEDCVIVAHQKEVCFPTEMKISSLLDEAVVIKKAMPP